MSQKAGRKAKILHIIDNLDKGGAEVLLVNTIKDLTGYDHVIIALHGPDRLSKCLPKNIKFYQMNFKLNRRFLFKLIQWKNVKDLKRLAENENPDVIHTHLFWSTIFGRIASTKQARFIFTVHSMMGDRVFKESLLYRSLERLSVSSNQRLIAVSQSVLDSYLKYIPFKGKTSLVYNYVPDIFFQKRKSSYKSKSNSFRIISIGNLKPVKNYGVQIKAMAILGPNYQLDIFGSGDEEEAKLRRLMVVHDIYNVNFRGSADNLHELLPTYDLFVMSSFSEGYAIARAEAMACALPVLLSNIPVFRETTERQDIFFEFDDADELARKIMKLRNNENLRKEFGRQNFELACRYNQREDYLLKLKHIYLGL